MKRIIGTFFIGGLLYLGVSLYSAGDSLNFLWADTSPPKNEELESQDIANDPIIEENLKELLKRDWVQVISKQPSTEDSAPVKKNEFIEKFIKPLQVNMDKALEKDLSRISEVFQDAQKLGVILSKCLNSEELCGQEEQYKDLTYFDPTITPYHRDLNRVLLAMGAVIRRDKSYVHELDKEMLLEILKNQNSDSPLLSTELLLQTDINLDEYREMMNNSREMQPTTKALFMNLISGSKKLRQSEYRQIFLTELYRTLSDTHDQYLAWEVQRNLYQYKLSEKQFKIAILKSCHLKNAGIGENLWPVIRKDLLNQIERSGLSINPDEICN